MNSPGYVGHVSCLFTIACYCCLVVGLWLRLGLDLMSGSLVVIHMYLYYFPLPLSLSSAGNALCGYLPQSGLIGV